MNYTVNTLHARTMNELVAWTEAQPVQGWRIVTLEYPRWKRKGTWSKAIMHTMREVKQTFLKGSLASQNKATGANDLRRIVALGGDRTNGIALHAHCLIEAIGDEGTFRKRLENAWINTVRKVTRSEHQPFYEREAQTYCRKAENGFSEYIYYMVRHEGNDLKFGVEKIEVPHTYLTAPTS